VTQPTPVYWTKWDGAARQLAFRGQRFESDAPPMDVFQGTVRAGERFLAWRVSCDADGKTTRIEANRSDGQMLLAERGSKGVTVNGTLRRDLDHATDADISVTPATNSLPIRRLRLERGEAAEIIALFVDAEAMTLSAARQRYTRLGDRRWRYEGLGTGFVAELETDAEDWVLDYPGLFRRTEAGPIS